MNELILIPILTTILTTVGTTIIIFLKERNQNNSKIKRQVIEQSLTELYNSLFSYSLIYTDKLEQSFYEVKRHQFENDGKLVPDEDMLCIHDKELWDGVIIELREVIHKKIHLLNHDDLRTWHKLELLGLDEKLNNTENINKYKALEEFLVDISLRYFEFYDVYHMKKKSSA